MTYQERPWVAHYPQEVPARLQYPDVPLTSFLEDSARDFPDRQATLFFGGALTYRQLWDQVRRLAAGLTGLGLQPGDRVAVMLPNCPQAVIAYYGTLLAGGVVVQTNPLYMDRELDHQLADSGAAFMVVVARAYPTGARSRARAGLRHVVVTGLQDYLPFPLNWLYPLTQRKNGKKGSKPAPILYGEGVHRFLDVLRTSPLAQYPKVGPRDLALLQYTGATTGLAKGCMLSHANLVANMRQIVAWLYRYERGKERVLAALPFFHVYGMTTAMNYAVFMAATMILTPRFAVGDILKLIEKYRPTLFPGAPTMYIAINNFPGVKKRDLSSIGACISGAAPLPAEVQETFEGLTGGKLVEGYGLTEASPVTHCNPLWGRRKAGSIGLPWPDTECRIIDGTTGQEVEVGQVGELAVRGPQVMVGYWNRPEDTAAALTKDGWLLTGDLARMDEEGYFYIVDRKKDVIIAGGFNIYPREVEEVLFEHPAV
ncbi:MAG: long-chain-fatty-acid--CoA ligase, partial [Bacillota bacterium]